MKSFITLLFIFLFSNTILFSQSKQDISDILKLVVDVYDAENIPIFNQLYNDLYEYELKVLKEGKTKNKSNIYLYDSININYKIFKKILRKTKDDSITSYYNAKSLKDKTSSRMAYVPIPIISTNRNKAVLNARYHCGIGCGTSTVFYFIKINNQWKISSFKIED